MLLIQTDKLNTNIFGIFSKIKHIRGPFDLVERNFFEKLRYNFEKQKV